MRAFGLGGAIARTGYCLELIDQRLAQWSAAQLQECCSSVLVGVIRVLDLAIVILAEILGLTLNGRPRRCGMAINECAATAMLGKCCSQIGLCFEASIVLRFLVDGGCHHEDATHIRWQFLDELIDVFLG